VSAGEPAAPASRVVPLSALVLIGANAVPLIGVVALHWTVYSILLLYWSENVVIGVSNILRMAFAQPRNVAVDAGKLFLIPFFTVHYGLFTLVHGIFVVTLFGPGGRSLGPAALVSAVRAAGIGYGLLAIALSHAFSFVHNYLASGEYRRASLSMLMAQPYARVMVLHVTILVGGFLAQAAGAPTVALVVLIGLKMALDLRAHVAERRKLGMVPAPNALIA
jgi:Family of unknown function (DUF6498)